jgi:NAD(P)-dependent dehydrogenase (short-subunit alcohol dehydrogenase family)
MKTVVITGASAGVGRATVRAFAQQGVRLGLIARGEEGLEAARKEAQHAGAHAVAVVADVAEADEVESAAKSFEAQLGPIDIWVNNAMTSVFAPLTELTPEEFRRVTEVTYLGTVYGTMAALRRMLPRDRGSIVQVGSALAYRGIPLQSAYSGAKHGVQGFTESLRSELLHEGSNVHVAMVQLPALNTPQFDISRSKMPRRPQPVAPIYEPELAAEAIVWAAHHRKREPWVGGSTLAVLVGNALAPGLGDRYLARTGYESQQTDEPAGPDRPDNLWEPVPGDHGAHGRFGADARSGSVQFVAARHRGRLLLVITALAGAVAARARRSRSY